MARIHPLKPDSVEAPIKGAFQKHVEEYKGRITNMKATLGHSLISFEAYINAGNLINVPWVEVEDVANAVVFLVSDKSRFVTGSQFVLDAGLLTR